MNQCFFLMILRPPRATRTDTLFHDTTLFRSLYPIGYLTSQIESLNVSKGNPVKIFPTVEPYEMPSVYKQCEWLIYTANPQVPTIGRSEEHTSELQSLMRTSYAVFCLITKKFKYLKSIYILLHIITTQNM